MSALDARQETRSMLESIDRWENEGGRHASQATTANSRSLAACQGHATRPQPARMAEELGIPAAAPRPIRMSGLDPLRETPLRAACSRLLNSCCHYDSVVNTMRQDSPR